MLAKVMLVQEFALHGPDAGIHYLGMEGHEGQFLQHHRVVDRVHGILAPDEGTVAVYQHRRHLIRINIAGLKSFNDHIAGFMLIPAFDF